MQQQYEQKLQQMNQQFQPKQQEPKPYQALLERLKGIDPEFATDREDCRDNSTSYLHLNQQLEGMRMERDRAFLLTKTR
jgi:chromosome segregation ATPase